MAAKTKSTSPCRPHYSKGQTLSFFSFAIVAGQQSQNLLGCLADEKLEWHFIGPLQNNKSKLVAEHFNWVHSIDNLKTAQRIARQRPAGLPAINVCLQVNVSAEASKGGVSPATTLNLARQISQLPNMTLRGLMTIPAATEDIVVQRQQFALLRELKEDLNRDGFNLDTLSMGMSHDLEAAILEGSTIVRVGTAIFGERH